MLARNALQSCRRSPMTTHLKISGSLAANQNMWKGGIDAYCSATYVDHVVPVEHFRVPSMPWVTRFVPLRLPHLLPSGPTCKAPSGDSAIVSEMLRSLPWQVVVAAPLEEENPPSAAKPRVGNVSFCSRAVGPYTWKAQSFLAVAI